MHFSGTCATAEASHPIGPASSFFRSPNSPSYRLQFKAAPGRATMRWLVAAGLLCLLQFGWWAVSTVRIGCALLFWPLALSLGFKMLKMLHEWVHYVQVREPVPPAYPATFRTVDMLTTACPGEPHQMIIRTLEAMQAVRYPHTSYLCDEGDDPVLRAACERLGVVHVTRQVKVHAKAGNINNALRQATGELCVVLDPDHVPTPDFLDQVTPYFEDERVGYVQVVQAYGNQQESLVALGAAEQTYHFYGPLMMGMNGYNSVQAIGANCTFRRAALDSIGGHAAGLTEDMHTAMLLHAKGWVSAYVPKVVSRGLVPASLAAFYSQQLKWSRGAFDLLFRVYPKVCRQFSWAQRLHYLLLPLYFFSGVIALIDLTLPLFALGTNQLPWLVNLSGLAMHALPLLAISLLIRCQAQRWLREPHESGLHLVGGFLRMGTWWIYTLGFVYAVLDIKVPYIPTPEEGRQSNEWLLALPNIVLALLLLAACKYGRVTAYGTYTQLLVDLALLNVVVLLAATAMGQHEALRNFIQDMASWPYRGLVLALHRLQATLSLWVGTWLRQFIRQVALVVLAVAGTVYFYYTDWLSRVPPEWLLTSTATVHVGQTLLPEPGAIAQVSDSPAATQAVAPESAIVAVPMPATDSAVQLPAAVHTLAQRHQIPLLSWPVSQAVAQRPAYWQALAQQLNQVPGAVLLQPQLEIADPVQYRHCWREMHRILRDEQVVNVVWVWTPEAADSQLTKFPGITYTNWIASHLQGSARTPDYPTLRNRLTYNLALHQMPVVLLAPAPAGSLLQAARRLASTYPEIKTVVFAAPATLPRQDGAMASLGLTKSVVIAP